MRILTGLFWLVMDLSRRLLQGIERLLYTVDEWLRFKSGQSTPALVAKAGLGVVWFFVSYVIRFGVNVLLEPQINPIKHFPWSPSRTRSSTRCSSRRVEATCSR